MKDIVAQIQKLYDSLIRNLQEVASQKERLDKDTVAFVETKKEYSEKFADVNHREKAIAQVEGLLQVQADAKVAKKESNVALNELAKERDNFNAFVQEQKQALASTKQANEQFELKIAKSNQKLISDRAELDAEKKDLKAQVLKEIGAKIGA